MKIHFKKKKKNKKTNSIIAKRIERWRGSDRRTRRRRGSAEWGGLGGVGWDGGGVGWDGVGRRRRGLGDERDESLRDERTDESLRVMMRVDGEIK